MSKREKIIGVTMAGFILLWVQMNMSQPDKEGLKPAEIVKKTFIKARKPAVVSKKGKGLDLSRVMEHVQLKFDKMPTSSPRDPFEKLEQRVDPKTSNLSDLVLTGIIWEKETPVALINDLILRQGESVSGFKIDTITQNEVILTKGMERYILKLPTEQQ